MAVGRGRLCCVLDAPNDGPTSTAGDVRLGAGWLRCGEGEASTAVVGGGCLLYVSRLSPWHVTPCRVVPL